MAPSKLAYVAVCVSLACSLSVAQDTETNATKASFSWLKKFEGTWASVSKQPGSDTVVGKGMMVSRVLGTQWVMNEFTAEVSGIPYTAIQNLGFDPSQKLFRGRWIDSMSDFEWTYEGTLNESGTTITLNADGPDWQDPSKIKKYRDVYEFKSDTQIAALSQIMNEGKWETFMTATMTKVEKTKPKVTPFLMFIGKAEEAIEYYKTVFDKFEVVGIKKYGPNVPGKKEGTVQLAEIKIEGQLVKFIDSPDVHDFSFTPSFSFFVECDSDDELNSKFEKLSSGGKVMMPLSNYGFSKRFGWTTDKFGISWQLNLD